MLGVGVSSVPEASCFPSELQLLLYDWVYVRVTSVAKYWGFQLAAIAHAGEGRARGQIRTSFPCGCVIWLLRSGMLFCFACFFVRSACSIWVQSGLPGDTKGGSSSSGAQAAGSWAAASLLPCTGFAVFGILPRSEGLLRFYFLGFHLSISFSSMCCDPSTALSWSSSKLKFLVLSQALWSFFIWKLNVYKLKQLT